MFLQAYLLYIEFFMENTHYQHKDNITLYQHTLIFFLFIIIIIILVYANKKRGNAFTFIINLNIIMKNRRFKIVF